MDAELPRAILLEPNDGLLTVGRKLAKRGVDVTALASPACAYVARSRYVEGRDMPALPEGRAAWLAALNELAARGEGVLLSGSDAATEFLQRERTLIPDRLRSFESADGPHLGFMGKDAQHAVAQRVGVRVPWSRRVDSVEQLEELASEVDYPCILKPVLSHVGKRLGGLRTLQVDTADELVQVGRRPLEAGVEMLVTEHVPGGEERLEGAVTIRMPDGSFPLAYGRRKVRQHPAGYGVGSLHEAWPVPDAIEMARTLLGAVDFVGISILEAKRHAVTGELVLIEVNVRVPGGYGLSEACGVDGSWRLYACLAGVPLGPQPSPDYGARCVLPYLDVLAVAALLREDELSVRDALGSWRRVRDFGVLDVRDPAPGVAVIRRMVSGKRKRNNGG